MKLKHIQLNVSGIKFKGIQISVLFHNYNIAYTPQHLGQTETFQQQLDGLP